MRKRRQRKGKPMLGRTMQGRTRQKRHWTDRHSFLDGGVLGDCPTSKKNKERGPFKSLKITNINYQPSLGWGVPRVKGGVWENPINLKGTVQRTTQ